MKLTLSHFRYHSCKEITCEVGLNLLSGPSGIGKSTLLEAIYWLLFRRLRSVDPLNSKNKPTTVRLEYNDIVIQRQRNPGKLVVQVGSAVYMDDIAQSWIESKWGYHDAFLSSSYLRQSEQAFIFTLTNAARFELFNWFSFYGDQPSKYTLKIEAVLKKLNTEFSSIRATYEAGLTWLNAELPSLSHDKVTDKDIQECKTKIADGTKRQGELTSLLNVAEQVSKRKRALEREQDEICQRLKEVSEEKLDLEALKLEHSQIIEKLRRQEDIVRQCQQYRLLKQEQDSLKINSKAEFVDLTSITMFARFSSIAAKYSIDYTDAEYTRIKDLDARFTRYQKYQEYKKNEEEKVKITKELEKLRKDFEVIGSVTPPPSNYSFLLANRDNIIECQRLLAKTRWASKDVDKARPYLSLFASRESLLQAKENRDKLIAKYGSLSSLKHMCEAFNCPSCHATLQYKDGKAILLSTDPKIFRQEYEELSRLESMLASYAWIDWNYFISLKEEEVKEQVSLGDQLKRYASVSWVADDVTNLAEQVEKFKEKERLERLIDQYERKILTFDKSVEEQEYISDFDNIQRYRAWLRENQGHPIYSDFKVTETEWHAFQRYKTLEAKLSPLRSMAEKNLEEETKTLVHLKTKFQELTLNISTEQQNRSLREHLITSLEKVKKEINGLFDVKIEDVTREWNSVSNLLEEQRKLLIQYETSYRIVLRRQELQGMYDKLLALSTNIATGTNLLKICKEIEKERLRQIMATFNHQVNTILTDLFDDGISFFASTTKTIKTTGVEKDAFDFRIVLREQECDFSCLSGGEKYRVSTAIVLALSSLSPSPLIILDECLAFVNAEIKEKAIKAISRFSTSKIVLVVDHEMDGAWFDKVVSLTD